MHSQFILIFSLLLASNVNAFESAPSMIFVGSNYSGHEEITRQALNKIAQKIKDTNFSSELFNSDDLKFNLNPEPKGLFGYKAKNVVILGNFASDFPKQVNIMSLADFWNNRKISEFENAESQVLHFLKNYKNSLTLDSAYNTCINARANIKHVTLKAIEYWAAGDKTKALFLIGHAAHTIQDSFSPAHTIRLGAENNYNLQNVCYFGTVMNTKMDSRNPQLCYHKAPDSKDAIWNLKPDQYKKALSNWGSEKSTECNKQDSYPETDDAKKSCISHEARLARLATEKYLFLVFNQISPNNFIKKTTQSFVELLDTNLFDGPVGDSELDQKMSLGIMRCEGLSTEEIVGTEPQQPNGG